MLIQAPTVPNINPINFSNVRMNLSFIVSAQVEPVKRICYFHDKKLKYGVGCSAMDGRNLEHSILKTVLWILHFPYFFSSIIFAFLPFFIF